MKRRRFKKLLPLISLILFGAAVYILYDEAQHYSIQQLITHMQLLPSWQYLLALALVAAVYLILTLYDKLAFLYINEPQKWKKIALGAFLGYAFSNNISPTLLVGGSMRYRIYSSIGISGMSVTNVVAFNSISIWIGLMAVSSISFVFKSLTLPEQINLPIPLLSLQTLGWIFLVTLITYFVLTRLITGTVQFRGRTFRFPDTKLALGQLSVSSMDWLLSSAVLFLLLPPTSEVSYLYFIGIYAVAFIIGLMTQIPGGLGVFESINLLFLSPFMDSGEILTSLILFRLFYFVTPLIVASVLLVLFEWRKQVQPIEQS